MVFTELEVINLCVALASPIVAKELPLVNNDGIMEDSAFHSAYTELCALSIEISL